MPQYFWSVISIIENYSDSAVSHIYGQNKKLMSNKSNNITNWNISLITLFVLRLDRQVKIKYAQKILHFLCSSESGSCNSFPKIDDLIVVNFNLFYSSHFLSSLPLYTPNRPDRVGSALLHIYQVVSSPLQEYVHS